MVAIGNFNIDASMFSGVGTAIVQYLFYGTLCLIVMGVIGYLIYVGWNKKKYTNPVTLYKLREDGAYKENPFLMGGVIKGRSGVRDFQIKALKGRFKHNLGYMPDFGKMSADDRLYFVQQGDGTIWQQCEKRMELYKDIEETIDGQVVTNRYSLLVTPIPTDVKTATINNIHDVKNLMEKNKMTAYAISIIAFILMVIVQIIFLYFTRKR